ncbi:MAG: aspartate aminotransferase family protein [Anaerolineaceae bacterium]|nr:aspartate aminotransferase family protein [Anaerolineaceae bacterium]
MPPSKNTNSCFPSGGHSKEEVLAAMRAAREHDLRWQDGRVFSLIYNAGEEISQLLKEAYLLYFSENGLNPTAFPSLKKFEAEVVAMTAGLLGGDCETIGNLTSGGTDSLLMAILAAREWARKHHPEITDPEVVLPASAHPAFDKGGHYFGVRMVRVPVKPDLRADPQAMEAAITLNTILLAGSAPSYPHGVVDPIPELAAIALRHGLLFHVDACVGGLMLPFVRRLGYPVTDFDFSVAGVTSISADLHKYGYAAKGASVILFRNGDLRRHMFFASIDWAGGVYASPTLSGTRPGGAIAAAWAIMNYLGEEGYLELTSAVMQTARKIQDAIREIPDLKILGEPEMSVMAIASDTLNIYEVGDELSQLGWQLDRQQFPASLHLTLSPVHAQVADQFLSDISLAVSKVRRPNLRKRVNTLVVSAANAAARRLPERWLSRLTAKVSGLLGNEENGVPQRSAALYGLIGTLPNRGDLKELVLDLVDQFTRLPSKKDP